MGKDPVMPLWVADLITDPNVVVMNNEEFGVYMRLLFHCWLADSLPNDDLTLSKLSLTFRKWKKIGPRIMKLFILTESNVYIHKRIVKEKEKIAEYKEAQSLKGKRGAEKRWQRPWHRHSTGHTSNKQENDGRCHASAIAQAWPGHSSPSPSLPSPPLSQEDLSNSNISLTLNSSDEKKIQDTEILPKEKKEGKPEESKEPSASSKYVQRSEPPKDDPKPNWQMADLLAEIFAKHTGSRHTRSDEIPEYPIFVAISKRYTEQEIHSVQSEFQDAMHDVAAGKRERIRKPVAFLQSLFEQRFGEGSRKKDLKQQIEKEIDDAIAP